MSQHVTFLLLGLGNGAVFAALALALVLTYRSSGVINFATGSIALLTAYLYAFLRQGELIVLVPGLPQTVSIGGEMGLVPAVMLAVATAALLGLVLHLAVFRPLRSAPPVAKAVASLGVSLLITSLIAARLGTSAVAVQTFFPNDLWTAGQVRVPADRVFLAGTVLLLALAVTAVFRFTSFGLQTRAAAVSEKGAFVSGISPDRIAAYNWMISCAVAGLGGILIAPLVPLIPVSYTLFIVPALAAAIAGRFTFALVAVGVGLAIGMLQAEVQYLATTQDWMPSSGAPELVPLLLILVVLVLRAKPLPERGSIILQTLGRAPRPTSLLWPTVVPSLAAVLGLVFLSSQWRSGLISTLIFGIIALSVVVVTGYAGQVSLAQLPLAGVAAFLLTPIAEDLGVPFPLSPLLAALGAMVVGVVIGLPALRIRGLSVAVVTFALAFALEALWFRNLDFAGADGLTPPQPELFGLDLQVGSGAAFPRTTFGLLCLAVLVAVAIGVAKLRTSRLGSQMLAVRANERSAAAAGVDVVRVKLIAFALAAFIAGLGGALLAYKSGTVTYEPYAAIVGLAFFGTVYLAGITSVSGGIFAGVLSAGGLSYVLIEEVFSTGVWYEVIAAVLLILTVIFNPEGIIGHPQAVVAKRRADRAAARAGLVAGTAGTAAGSHVSPLPRTAPLDRPVPVTVTGPPVLEVTELTVRYGGVLAVDDISFQVMQGEIVGLIGPNGAGKTTAIDAISGFAPATGSMLLADQQLRGMSPHKRVRAGMARTFQAIELYDDLSVRENVVVGLTASAARRQGEGDPLEETLDLLGLREVADRPAGELSQGQRQLVSVARALVGRPRLLLLDEPAGGLDTTESLWLGDRLRAIRDSGVTILMVEHDMSLVLSLCDRIHVLNFGQLIASGTPAQIRADRNVAEAYLGSTHAEEVSA